MAIIPPADAAPAAPVHPHHLLCAPAWTEVRAHYDGGEVLRHLRRFIPRWDQGESEAEYAHRLKVTKYVPDFALAVDSLAGMFFDAEPRGETTWSRADGDDAAFGVLGDPLAPDSLAHRLLADADGNGTPWDVLFRRLVPALIHSNERYVYVEGASREGGAPTVRLVDALDVLNWSHGEGGRRTEALVREDGFESGTALEAPVARTTYLHLRLDGWTRLDERLQPTGEEGAWRYEMGGRPCLPLRRVAVPIERPLGLLMARWAGVMAKQGSHRDNLLTIANKPRNTFPDAESFNATKEALAEGFNTLVGNENGLPGYATPPTEPIAQADASLKADREHFQRAFFQSYGDAARQVTATEARQDRQSGPGAYLALLGAAVADAKNFALSMCEQAASRDRSRWGFARYAPPTSYEPFDAKAESQSLQELNDSGVPLGAKARADLALKVARYHGLDADREQVEAEAESPRGGTSPALPALRRRMQFDPDQA